MYFLIALALILLGGGVFWFFYVQKEKSLKKSRPWEDFWNQFNEEEKNILLMYYTEESLMEERLADFVNIKYKTKDYFEESKAVNNQFFNRLKDIITKHEKLNQVIKTLPEKNLLTFRAKHPSYKVFVKHQKMASFYHEIDLVSNGISTDFQQLNDYTTNIEWLKFAFNQEPLKEYQTEISEVISWVENKKQELPFQERLGLAMGPKNDLNALENFLDLVLDHDQYAIFLSLMVMETEDSRQKLIEILEADQTADQVNQWAHTLEHQKDKLAPMLLSKMQDFKGSDFQIANFIKFIQCLSVWNWTELSVIEPFTTNNNKIIRLASIRLLVFNKPSRITEFFEAEMNNLTSILEIIPKSDHWLVLSAIYARLQNCQEDTLNVLKTWIEEATNPTLLNAVCTSCAAHSIERKIEDKLFYVCRTCETPKKLSVDYHNIGGYIGQKPPDQKDLFWVPLWNAQTHLIKYAELDILALNPLPSETDYDRMINELVNVLHNQHPKNPLKIEVHLSSEIKLDDNSKRLLSEISL